MAITSIHCQIAYESVLRAQMTKSLGKSVINLYSNIACSVPGIGNQQDLSDDLECDLFLNTAMQRFTCALYYPIARTRIQTFTTIIEVILKFGTMNEIMERWSFMNTFTSKTLLVIDKSVLESPFSYLYSFEDCLRENDVIPHKNERD